VSNADLRSFALFSMEEEKKKKEKKKKKLFYLLCQGYFPRSDGLSDVEELIIVQDSILPVYTRLFSYHPFHCSERK
jgi:hypothetical protein